MSVASDRIQFMSLTMKDSEIAKASGVPRIIITRTRVEQIRLPTRYDSTIRDTYQRTAYHRLQDAGASVREAHRYSWHSPTKNRFLVESMNKRALFYGSGLAAHRINVLTDQGKPVDFESILAKAIEDVKEGMRRSEAPLEDILEGT